ncbi:hypothetical protein KA344_15455 [bacterium]|nr:hypothetical protein [bacterium]
MKTSQKIHLIAAIFPAALLSSSVNFLLPQPLAAANDSEYAAGVKDYASKNFKGASDHFSKSIQGGNKSASVWLYSAHCFVAMGQYKRALQTYEIIAQSFKGTSEAATAGKSIESLRSRLGMPAATATQSTAAPAGGAAGTSAATAGDEGLMARVDIIPPKFGHPPVSQASIKAVKDAIGALPAPLRKKLDDTPEAHVTLSPNLIDRWPDTAKEGPDESGVDLAALPGRIYGKDMSIYERARISGTTSLRDPRPPKHLRQTTLNMCFQLLDDNMVISKDPDLRKEWEADKASISSPMSETLATFMKEDDWGPRETCSELFGFMLGGYNDMTENVLRYFPRTKKWLAAKMGIK